MKRTSMATILILATLAAAGCSGGDDPARAVTTAPAVKSAASATQAALPQPNAELSPERVIKTIVEALGQNDKPYADAGIATTFNFASPENKKLTGPLQRFTPMVKSPAYRPLIEYLDVAYGHVVVDGGEARMMVTVRSEDGDTNGYVFILKRQSDGEFKGCWMTDGVVGVRPGDEAPSTQPAEETGHGVLRV